MSKRESAIVILEGIKINTSLLAEAFKKVTDRPPALEANLHLLKLYAQSIKKDL